MSYYDKKGKKLCQKVRQNVTCFIYFPPLAYVLLNN